MSSMRTVQMGTMRIVPEGSTEQQVHFQAMRTVFSSNVWQKTPVGKEQPTRSRQLQATLTAEIKINGVKALTLFDAGSMTDSIMPEFAFTTKAKTFKLEEQVILQLGCAGSRSKISYGTHVPVNIDQFKDEVYCDLVNIDLVEWAIATHGMYESRLCFNIFTTTHVPLLP